ncbi:MAG TPA: thioredoxin [Chitinophagaceae bacterium]|nr:thioredoxin [Chitinophagaceae bacterium]
MISFEGHIEGDKPVVVDFYADWCSPCRMMEPVLREVKDAVGERATVLKIDIDKNPSLSQRYGIQSVPTLIIFHKGKILWRNSGVTPSYEILRHLNMTA